MTMIRILFPRCVKGSSKGICKKQKEPCVTLRINKQSDGEKAYSLYFNRIAHRLVGNNVGCIIQGDRVKETKAYAGLDFIFLDDLQDRPEGFRPEDVLPIAENSCGGTGFTVGITNFGRGIRIEKLFKDLGTRSIMLDGPNTEGDVLHYNMQFSKDKILL